MKVESRVIMCRCTSIELFGILRSSWLAEKEFDTIRDTEEFKAILEQLS